MSCCTNANGGKFVRSHHPKKVQRVHRSTATARRTSPLSILSENTRTLTIESKRIKNSPSRSIRNEFCAVRASSVWRRRTLVRMPQTAGDSLSKFVIKSAFLIFHKFWVYVFVPHIFIKMFLQIFKQLKSINFKKRSSKNVIHCSSHRETEKANVLGNNWGNITKEKNQ